MSNCYPCLIGLVVSMYPPIDVSPVRNPILKSLPNALIEIYSVPYNRKIFPRQWFIKNTKLKSRNSSGRIQGIINVAALSVLLNLGLAGCTTLHGYVERDSLIDFFKSTMARDNRPSWPRSIFFRDGREEGLPLMSKDARAHALLDREVPLLSAA